MNQIKNIRYSFEEYGIEFNFMNNTGDWMNAILQPPNTPDSQHFIDSENYDSENEQHHAIFEELKEFYYADFKDIECAKASIVAQERILHVEQSGNYYAAFSTDNAHVLKEGRASSYYNVFYFDKFDNETDLSEDEIIETAKKAWFASLKKELDAKLTEWNAEWEQGGFATAGNYIDDLDGMAYNCPDETVGEFMRDNFESEWQDSDIAQDFYQNIACDFRSDAQYDAQERLEMMRAIKSVEEY